MQAPTPAPTLQAPREVSVEAMVWDDLQKNDMVWPTIAETIGYRQQVYDKISKTIATLPCLEDCASKYEQDDLKGTPEAYRRL